MIAIRTVPQELRVALTLALLAIALAAPAAASSDLSVEQLSVIGPDGRAVSTIARGQEVSMTLRFRIRGAFRGRVGEITVARLCDPAPLLVCSYNMSLEAPSLSVPLTTTPCRFTPTDAGHYMLRARLDPGEALAETNENNNQSEKILAVEVEGPEIRISTQALTIGELIEQRMFTRRSFFISNAGAGALSVRITPDLPAPWLHVTPAELNLANCESKEVKVVADWSPEIRTQVSDRRLLISSNDRDGSVHVKFANALCSPPVTISPSNGGTIATSGSRVCGEVVTVRATPAPGFRFVRWRADSVTFSTSTAISFFNSSGARRLVAEFGRIP